MEKKKKKKRVGLVIFLVFLALLILPPVLLYAYLSVDHFHVDELRAGYDPNAAYAGQAVFTPEGNAEVIFSVNDLYWLMDESDVLSEIKIPLTDLEKIALEVDRDALTLYADAKLLGFLPLPLKAEAAATGGSKLTLTLQNVFLGKWIRIPAKTLEKYGLESSYELEFSSLDADIDVQALRLEKGQAVITVPFLQDFCKGVYPNMTADTLLLYGETLDEAARVASACYRTADSDTLTRRQLVLDAVLASAQPVDTMKRLLALGDPTEAKIALAKLSAFETRFILPVSLEEVDACRAAYTAPIAAYHEKLQTLLDGLRGKYKALELELTRKEYIDLATGAPLSVAALCPALELDDARCRAMLLTATETRKAAAAAEMPAFSEIPKSKGLRLDMALDYMSYDIGLMLPLPDGSTALLYYASTGEMIVQCLPAETVEKTLAGYAAPRVLNLDGMTFSFKRIVHGAPADGLANYIVFLPWDIEAAYALEQK